MSEMVDRSANDDRRLQVPPSCSTGSHSLPQDRLDSPQLVRDWVSDGVMIGASVALGARRARLLPTRSAERLNQLNSNRYHQLDRIIRTMKCMNERVNAARSGLSRSGGGSTLLSVIRKNRPSHMANFDMANG